MLPVLFALTVLSAPVTPADTTVQLRRGDVLVVQNLSGSLAVGAWDRDELQLRGEDGDPADVGVRREGSTVALVPSARHGHGRGVDVELRVPAWMALEVQGRNLDVTVRGTSGGVSIRNVEGDIRVEDTRGDLTLSTVEGEVWVRGARGTVHARSQGDDVTLEDVVGDVEVESGSGDLGLRRVDGMRVRAETLDGDVDFDGPIRRGGIYAFSVHDGDARLAIPRNAGVEVSVATFDGEFSSEFPVTLQTYRGGRAFDFTLGGGGARLEIKVFDGEIRLIERR